ncbi:hypothetical protein [Paenibacillus sp. SI8]|uniref:hypothetical protein n=1 Tax=unclassified Paenibacillus TaxID=185978 RepID=UPI003467102A
MFCAVIILMLISGCSSEAGKLVPDAFSAKDLCMEKTGFPDSEICYGTDRKRVERILGSGKGSGVVQKYDDGVSVMYREDKVAGLAIGFSLEKRMQITRGIRIGSKKEEVEQKYGKKYAIVTALGGTLYSFYKENNLPLERKAYKSERSDDEKQGVFEIWFSYDKAGGVNEIILSDQRMSAEKK